MYVRSLALSSTQRHADGHARHPGLVQPLEPQVAMQRLQALMQLWLAGQVEPLPLPLKTAIAAGQDDLNAATQAYEGSYMLGGNAKTPAGRAAGPTGRR